MTRRRNMAAVRREENRDHPGVAPPPQVAQDAPDRRFDFKDRLYAAAADINEWEPSFGAVVKLLFSMRITAALWGIIADCDEVYNYWEPLHLFIYGHGFQTWEYSPVYAIRSYLYIYLYYIPAGFFATLFGDTKVIIFVLIRLMNGVFCLLGEYYLYSAVCKRLNVPTGRNYILFSMFSSGMFIASTAFLPSSFAMTLNFYLLGAYLNEKWGIAIGCTALSAMIGWPFAAVLGIPLVIEMLLIRPLRTEFIAWASFFGVTIGGLLWICDSYYFGKRVFAPLNIVLYNVLSGPGPELYGVEPLSYYLKNLFLNWNIAILFAAICLPISFVCYLIHHDSSAVSKKLHIPNNLAYWSRYTPVFLIYFTAAVWCAIFFTQPHKEERFMYPIYPHIALLAGVAFDAIVRLLSKVNKTMGNGFYALLLAFVLISGSRSYAIHANYGSHLEMYKGLSERLITGVDHGDKPYHLQTAIRVCVGKEWHRFPSSFFIPEYVLDVNNKRIEVEMSFIRSEFRGLLPKPYIRGKSLVEITRHIPTEMNDMNQGVESRYVELNTCNYVMDVDMPATDREPDLRTKSNQFVPLLQLPFIIASESHPFYRAFYVPYFTAKNTKWTNYTLYGRAKN